MEREYPYQPLYGDRNRSRGEDFGVLSSTWAEFQLLLHSVNYRCIKASTVYFLDNFKFKFSVSITVMMVESSKLRLLHRLRILASI